MSPTSMIPVPEACRKGLTKECFDEHPKWAKQIFAQMLIGCLFPPWLTCKLQELKPDLLDPPPVLPEPVPPPPVPPPPVPPPPVPPPPVPPPPVPPPPVPAPISPPPIPTAPFPAPPCTVAPQWTRAWWKKFWKSTSWGNWHRNIAHFGLFPSMYLPIWYPGPTRTGHYTPPKKKITLTFRSSSADGLVGREIFVKSWDDLRNAPAGTYIRNNKESNTTIAGPYGYPGYWSLVRGFYFFDISKIPEKATIISTKLEVSGKQQHYGNLCLQEGTQTDPITIDSYQSFSGEHFGWIAWDSSVVPPYPRLSFDLNDTGKEYIKSKFSDIAKICIREYDHDYLNVDIGDDDDAESGGWWNEAANENDRPLLTIKYSI